MTRDKALLILQREAENIADLILNIREGCSTAASLKERLDAYNLAIAALQAQMLKEEMYFGNLMAATGQLLSTESVIARAEASGMHAAASLTYCGECEHYYSSVVSDEMCCHENRYIDGGPQPRDRHDFCSRGVKRKEHK